MNDQTVGLKHAKAPDYIHASLTVTLGGSDDFEVAKVYLGVQYFDEVTLESMGGILGEGPDTVTLSHFNDKLPDLPFSSVTKVQGFSVSLSADAGVAGGKLMAGIGYVDAEPACTSEEGAARLPERHGEQQHRDRSAHHPLGGEPGLRLSDEQAHGRRCRGLLRQRQDAIQELRRRMNPELLFVVRRPASSLLIA